MEPLVLVENGFPVLVGKRVIWKVLLDIHPERAESPAKLIVGDGPGPLQEVDPLIELLQRSHDNVVGRSGHGGCRRRRLPVPKSGGQEAPGPHSEV